MLPDSPTSWADARARFRWDIPARTNIGVDVCDRHCTAPDGAERPAIIVEDADGTVTTTSFGDLKDQSDRLAVALAARGVQRGDRVAVLLPQSVETAVAHIAAYKLGCVAVPLFVLFGEDALEYRLADSGARAVVTDAANVGRVLDLKARLPDLSCVLTAGGATGAAEDLHAAMDAADPSGFSPADTAADDPAVIIYTSGTTGKPKGALHAHRVLRGHLPGVEMPHELFPKEGDLFWTPADWAWIGGLLDVLLPALFHGVPVLAHRARKFDAEEAFCLMARHKVRNVFMPPTALKMLRQVKDPARFGVRLRSIGSGGETLGRELLDWGRDALGLTINEFYGQTECNLVLGNCAGLGEVREGSMGRAIPGHTVAIIDDTGTELPAGSDGHIAVKAPDPVMFLGYWNKPEATAEKFIGDWLVTGDTGRMDDDGWFWFLGRADDVITTAGYRVGPGEVEDALIRHPAVRLAAAVGVPDPDRTEIVKAFIVPADTAVLDDPDRQEALAAEIQEFVKTRMARHAYPRRIEFVADLPMTTTGKIQRKVLREHG
ncbi:Acetyl-coenzyme A synthetase [Caenispirillum salinarum AK4]|uniref:Acetyl-coenzyme A synthetase n=1 Tax=Caenispirillum salinarum AK4 TaxID=1238182 RepID=K9HNG4_9PROT|nr:acyl-CoA synthetase [Caenispirillum salinarum]EKV30046.1 Acetyl-coenzyme A synthetase [Caenispirillum salinarum AK4]